MRKAVSVTALVSSLMAGSALAAPAFAARGRDESGAAPQPALQQVRQDETLVEGMRALHRQMAARVEELLAAAQAGAPRLLFVDQPGMDDPAVKLAGATVPTEKVTFLGVATSRVSDTLQQQLKLPAGIGLVVEYVEKGSPAETAGIRIHDIVEKFDDQWVVNQEQFTVLVRMKKPGDEATLTVLRGGQPSVTKVSLSEKEVPVSTELAPGLPALGAAGLGVPEFELRPAGAGGGAVAGRPPGWTFQRSSMKVSPDGTVEKKLADEQGEIDLTRSRDGETSLVVKDHAGKEVYSGPYDTPEEKARVPVALAAKVASLDEGVHLQTGGGAGAGLVHTGVGKWALMTRTDDAQVIVLRMDEKGKHATVRDAKSNALLFDGPVNTPEELKASDGRISEKVAAMEAKLGG